MSLPRIFVQIASYRDPECQWTVKDLFEKATHPERLSVGICWQHVPDEDKHCFEVETRPEQVRVLHVDARESRGACWARSETQKLWDGEEFTLQIDSHMRFEPGWDVTLLKMLMQCESRRPILTGYPPGYFPPNDLRKDVIYSMAPKEFDQHGTLTFRSKAIPVAQAPALPIPAVACSAGFWFASSLIIREVPYDPYLYFFGEEVSMSARFWTHGWDLFHPNQLVIYHFWKRDQRRTHFDDHQNWLDLNSISRRRVAHQLGVQPASDPAVLERLDEFGLGNARSLADYEKLLDVSFAQRRVNGYIPPPAPAKPAQNGHATLAPAVISSSSHQPKKVFESAQAIIFDDFLDENAFEKVYDYTRLTDYKFINTSGTVSRVWRPRDGFPLRSVRNLSYLANPEGQPKTEDTYPTNTPMDLFAENIVRALPKVEALIGKMGENWIKFSVTSWMYPTSTGLSLHDDGGSYAGAYTFFLNPTWNIHWGGLLLLLAPETCAAVAAHKSKHGYEFVRRKWSDEEEENAFVWDPGLAQCVFPKCNRIVFIAHDALHAVTTVNPSAGDNIRRSFAGFFGKK